MIRRFERERKLEVDEKVLIYVLSLIGKVKFADDWDETSYVVLEIPSLQMAKTTVKVVLRPCTQTSHYHSHACHLSHFLMLSRHISSKGLCDTEVQSSV